LLAVLQRAAEFCRWSEGRWGPLGGRLHDLWGLRRAAAVEPPRRLTEEAAANTSCDRLQLDAAAGTATLAAGARLDLWGFARGAAVDAAMARLAADGAADASVTLGPVQRASGTGPAGDGWPLAVAVPEAIAHLTRRLALRDLAFALASPSAGALRAGDSTRPPYLDHRLGRPGSGVLAVAAVTTQALDAEALAATGFVTGNRRGAVLLGQLRPSPSALWLLGEGGGTPLVTDYRWGALPRRSAAE
jgi:thiamine biosynthesis lipoprotein ApbE